MICSGNVYHVLANVNSGSGGMFDLEVIGSIKPTDIVLVHNSGVKHGAL